MVSGGRGGIRKFSSLKGVGGGGHPKIFKLEGGGWGGIQKFSSLKGVGGGRGGIRKFSSLKGVGGGGGIPKGLKVLRA